MKGLLVARQELALFSSKERMTKHSLIGTFWDVRRPAKPAARRLEVNLNDFLRVGVVQHLRQVVTLLFLDGNDNKVRPPPKP